MSATNDRDHAARMAGWNNDQALRIARNIGDPWYRCQALSSVARHAPDPKTFLSLIADSLEDGWSVEGANRSVTVVAWPVAALANRSDPGREASERIDRVLLEAVARVIRTIVEEPSPASRADALLFHVHALSPTRRELRDRVLAPFLKDCRDAANRKRRRQLERAALVIAPDDPDAALRLAASLDENRRRRTIEKIEGKAEGLGPRRF
ncbi:hypothetical protein [Paludisphaera soli]|uniref:hypothetical protein n=1 Tax=Paludisphaera soli TaxID=2712865 RepID=UPI0013EAD6B9|nr:hypothetical protein [Paludisphaera soli]